MKALAILAAVSAVTATAALAAGEPTAAQPQVTVTARPAPDDRINQQTSAFVRDITASRDGEALIRWSAPICPLAAGLDNGLNAALTQRLAAVARAAGAPMADAGCRPNFVVIVTGDPARVLAAWSKREPDVFSGDWASDLGAFPSKARPARVWYATERIATAGSTITTQPGQYSGLPTIIDPTLSRLQFKTVLGIQAAVVVIDQNQAQGFTVAQIADYASMVGLAQLKIDADLGDAPTILRMFKQPEAERPDGLTAWDRAFLAGLYRTDTANRLQRSAIAASVAAAATATPQRR